jgi:hypothetical protein
VVEILSPGTKCRDLDTIYRRRGDETTFQFPKEFSKAARDVVKTDLLTSTF